MSLEARGLYITMLCEQWDGGALPADAAELARLVGIDVATVHRLWSEVSPCFERTDAGLLNARLEDVRANQEAKAKRLSESGRRAANARWGK